MPNLNGDSANPSGDLNPLLNTYQLSSYHYDLPDRLIAQEPASPRDSSKLLVIHRKSGRWEHRHFRDLPEYLDSHDLIVANNTEVIKARLVGQRIRNGVLGGRVEFVMLVELGPSLWEGLFHASAKYLPGLEFQISTPDGIGLKGVLTRGSGESPSGTVVAQFDRDPLQSGAGSIPLPHYIHDIPRGNGRDSEVDEKNYQTLYAKSKGSAAAPTAGLHFTPEVFANLKARGVSWAEITLHVGLGTFRPVKTDDIRNHVMHEERFEISQSVANQIQTQKQSGGRVIAVGTTSVRTLEGAWQQGESGMPKGLKSGLGRTSIFIRPGSHSFEVVDAMITNFHLPCSTLLMLVSAFAGRELILEAYREAVRQEYRFFSYGDAMLIV